MADLLRWRRTSDGNWEAGPYRCLKAGPRGGWKIIGPNGIELGFQWKLNGLAGAKHTCLIHARKQERTRHDSL